jgi:mercuric ion transport protein
MKNHKLLTTGIVGTIIAALCCFTPLLVVVLGAVGLSAWLGWLDFVLLPALGIFIVITIYAVVQLMKRDRVSEAND